MRQPIDTPDFEHFPDEVEKHGAKMLRVFLGALLVFAVIGIFLSLAMPAKAVHLSKGAEICQTVMETRAELRQAAKNENAQLRLRWNAKTRELYAVVGGHTQAYIVTYKDGCAHGQHHMLAAKALRVIDALPACETINDKLIWVSAGDHAAELANAAKARTMIENQFPKAQIKTHILWVYWPGDAYGWGFYFMDGCYDFLTTPTAEFVRGVLSEPQR